MRKTPFFIALLFLLMITTHAQTFSSGSSGAEGALDLTAGNREVQLPESGILNYTTVTIPRGKTLTFKRNSRNSPVIMLAQGDVLIDGDINISATYVYSGPGGFDGGDPGLIEGKPGYGPGGGMAGKWIGPFSLVPNIGGSGGGGGSGQFSSSGGGGGGAITIASSTKISLSGNITATGGCPNGFCNSSRGGAGGAIRLVANSIQVTGVLNAQGNDQGGPGMIRIEAPAGFLTFAGTGTPLPVLATVNSTIIPMNAPSLIVSSIAGYSITPAALGRSNLIDLLLPAQLPDPISVVVKGNGIPLGTQVKMNIGGAGKPVASVGTLSGTLLSSTATLNVSGLSKDGSVSVLFVYATFDLPQTSQNFNQEGKDKIAQVRVVAAPGARPKYVFLRRDGSEIEKNKVPPAILQQFNSLDN